MTNKPSEVIESGEEVISNIAALLMHDNQGMSESDAREIAITMIEEHGLAALSTCYRSN